MFWYNGKSSAYLALKQYDQAIEWARRAIAINPNNNAIAHANLIAALALAGHEQEAGEALQRYLALSSNGLKTVAAWKANFALGVKTDGDPRVLEANTRQLDGLRKAGLPEE
jgi:tetratricopeptide (TPR) repeat protein